MYCLHTSSWARFDNFGSFARFRARLIEKAALKCQERFLATCCSYIIAVSREAELRKNGEVLQLGSYVELRRENSGLRPFFALIEYVHGFELPDDVFNDPEFMRLYWLGADAICLSNVIFLSPWCCE